MPPLDADEIERLILKYTNLEREQHNLPPLRYDARISEVARAHSEDMAANGYLHYLHGAGPIERGKAAGFGCGFGENIHEHPQRMGDYWLDTAEMARALVRDWMNSPNHRVNILGLGHSIGGISRNCQDLQRQLSVPNLALCRQKYGSFKITFWREREELALLG